MAIDVGHLQLVPLAPLVGYAAAVWLKKRPDSTGRLGVTGFCFGGGIANSLAVRMGSDLQAAVPFYGGAAPAADVPKIKAPKCGFLRRSLIRRESAQLIG